MNILGVSAFVHSAIDMKPLAFRFDDGFSVELVNEVQVIKTKN